MQLSLAAASLAVAAPEAAAAVVPGLGWQTLLLGLQQALLLVLQWVSC